MIVDADMRFDPQLDRVLVECEPAGGAHLANRDRGSRPVHQPRGGLNDHLEAHAKWNDRQTVARDAAPLDWGSRGVVPQEQVVFRAQREARLQALGRHADEVADE